MKKIIRIFAVFSVSFMIVWILTGLGWILIARPKMDEENPYLLAPIVVLLFIWALIGLIEFIKHFTEIKTEVKKYIRNGNLNI